MGKELAKIQRFEVEGRDKVMRISTQELISHGCKNCVWRLHNQCVHDIVKDNEFFEFTDNETRHQGYCMEYVQFILGFAEGSESISSVWEKFHLYVKRIQSLEDYKDYMKLVDEIKKKEAEGLDWQELSKLRIKIEESRLWWERLSDTVQKGYGRIADRESKSRDASRVPPQMNAKVINFYPEKKD